MKYSTYLRNHVVYPGSEKALHAFLNATIERNGKKDKPHDQIIRKLRIGLDVRI